MWSTRHPFGSKNDSKKELVSFKRLDVYLNIVCSFLSTGAISTVLSLRQPRRIPTMKTNQWTRIRTPALTIKRSTTTWTTCSIRYEALSPSRSLVSFVSVWSCLQIKQGNQLDSGPFSPPKPSSSKPSTQKQSAPERPDVLFTCLSVDLAKLNRHWQYTYHFPLSHDESSVHDCNQRHVMLYGVGKGE